MEAFAYFSTFRPGCQEPVQNAFPVLSCLCYFLPFPAISCGSCYFLRCPPISGEFVLFTAVFLGLKCVLKIVSKSIQNQPKINPKSTPNWSKITQKSSQNRSKMAPWRGSRFLMIFHHILDQFSIQKLPQKHIENHMQKCFEKGTPLDVSSVPLGVHFCSKCHVFSERFSSIDFERAFYMFR